MLLCHSAVNLIYNTNQQCYGKDKLSKNTFLTPPHFETPTDITIKGEKLCAGHRSTIYHHAKFHANWWQRRLDICLSQTVGEKKELQQI